MKSAGPDWVKVSARMPKGLIDKLTRLYPHESLSGLLRGIIEREINRQKILKEHMKLYGRFKPEYFDESLL